MADSLYDRTTSGFPLSISTALAFESLFSPRQAVYDPAREKPPEIHIDQYNQMWINMDTLFRNMLQASTKEAIMNTGYKETASVLIDEMDTIRSLLAQEGRGVCRPVFYHCDYEKAFSGINKAFTVRKDTTANQIFQRDLREKTMKELKRLEAGVTFLPGPVKAENRPSALMLTHVPYDLVSKKYFEKLDLLESNTGKLKKPAQWNTKYYPVPNRDMTILPFYRFLLMSLGDKVYFQPMPMKIREQIMTTAEKRNWTPVTTVDKCLLDLSLDLHPFDYSVIATARSAA